VLIAVRTLIQKLANLLTNDVRGKTRVHARLACSQEWERDGMEATATCSQQGLAHTILERRHRIIAAKHNCVDDVLAVQVIARCDGDFAWCQGVKAASNLFTDLGAAKAMNTAVET